MDSDDFARELILDHVRRPRNFGEMADADIWRAGDNPSCGDTLTLFLKWRGDCVAQAGFTGAGCSICMASASLMTQKAKALTKAEARALARRFRHMLTAPEEPPDAAALGDLRVFAGVRKLPLRVNCALLAWRLLEEALEAV